jgi:hypothetical protein
MPFTQGLCQLVKVGGGGGGGGGDTWGSFGKFL